MAKTKLAKTRNTECCQRPIVRFGNCKLKSISPVLEQSSSNCTYRRAWGHTARKLARWHNACLQDSLSPARKAETHKETSPLTGPSSLYLLTSQDPPHVGNVEKTQALPRRERGLNKSLATWGTWRKHGLCLAGNVD